MIPDSIAVGPKVGLQKNCFAGEMEKMKMAGVIIRISAVAGVMAFIFDRLGSGDMPRHRTYGIYEKYVKRPLDAVLSTGALIILSPVMLVTAMLVRMKLGPPVIFKQERPGLGGRIFTIRKFRTMRDGEGTDGERLTDFGRKLRASSIDELPELVNIIKGDMSIVGPRPLLAEYLPRYSECQSHRHDVRPGLTGLAQVSGRNGLSWDEKFEDDLKYVDHITFLEDVTILMKTVMTVLKREGINANEKTTMPEFTGSE